MPRVQVDRGAIRFVFAGANVMCPGLTSPGARMDTELPALTPVVRPHRFPTPQAIFAEGKEHALAIGFLRMSTEEIRAVNKDIGIEVLHHLDDGLWRMPHLD
jgi:PUA domain protein